MVGSTQRSPVPAPLHLLVSQFYLVYSQRPKMTEKVNLSASGLLNDFFESSHRMAFYYLLTCTCVGIHPGRVEPASPIALTTSRTEAFQARRSCASSQDTFTQSFLHRAWPKTRGPEIGSRSALVVVPHVFSWSPVRLRHVRGGVGRRRSLIRSPSGRLAAWPFTNKTISSLMPCRFTNVIFTIDQSRFIC